MYRFSITNAFRFATHTQAERESQVLTKLSVIDYSLLFRILFDFIFVSFSSVSHVHKCTTILSIFDFADNEIQIAP